ncbi:MAG: hypothetical protein ACI4SH_03750 [Candidatus Scatosoma sp.]
MKKFDKNNYRFIDLSETDHTQFSPLELDGMIEDTKEVLAVTKKKIKSTPMNLALAAGLLGVRGGEFIKINALTGAKWKKGNATKDERKLIKKVFSTARIYYLFKIVITLIKKEGAVDQLNPTIVQKIKDE